MGEPRSRTNRVFAHLTTFEKAFPALEDVRIEYTEGSIGSGLVDKSQSDFRSFTTIRSTGGQARCSNPSCYRGGYEFDFDVHDMVRGKLVTKRFYKPCEGDEGTPKGRKIGRRCDHAIIAKLTITYLAESAPARVTLQQRLSRIECRRCPACRRFTGLIPGAAERSLTCGDHEFKLLPDGNLELTSRGRDAWPRVGQLFGETGQDKVLLECLSLQEDEARSVIGGVSNELLRVVGQCLSVNIPVLVLSMQPWRQVVKIENALDLKALSSRTIEDCWI
jgi:hypothetical protein